MVEVSYMGTWTLGADNAHGPQRAGAGPGLDPGAPADSAVEPHQRDPLRRQVDLPRRDASRPSAGCADNFAYNVSYTLSHSKDDASSPGATESEANVPQNVRNIFDETGEWALSSFDHRHQFIASGVYQLPFFDGAGGVAEAVLGGWRANAIFIAQSGAPFTVNLGVDRANIGAGPAQRPDQLRDPNLPGGERTPERWFDTVGVRAAGAVHVRQRAAQQRHRPGLRQRRFRAGQDVDAARRPRSSSSAGRSSTCSTARTSTCRTGSSATRTSAGSSARRTRARCSSASGSPSRVASRRAG